MYVYGLIMKQCKNPANTIADIVRIYVDYGRYIENSPMCWKMNLDAETRRHAKMSPVSPYRLLQTM